MNDRPESFCPQAQGHDGPCGEGERSPTSVCGKPVGVKSVREVMEEAKAAGQLNLAPEDVAKDEAGEFFDSVAEYDALRAKEGDARFEALLEIARNETSHCWWVDGGPGQAGSEEESSTPRYADGRPCASDCPACAVEALAASDRTLSDLGRAIERDIVLKRLDDWLDGGTPGAERNASLRGRLQKPNMTWVVELVDRAGTPPFFARGTSHNLAKAVNDALDGMNKITGGPDGA